VQILVDSDHCIELASPQRIAIFCSLRTAIIEPRESYNPDLYPHLAAGYRPRRIVLETTHLMTAISDVRIRCGHCRAVFPSPVAFGDIESLESAIASGLQASCPSCGQMVNCNDKNMMWQYADGSGGGLFA